MALDLVARLARGVEALAVLEGYRSRLATVAAYTADARGRDVVERNIQIAVQAAIDLADELIAARGWGRPVSAAAAAATLGGKKVLKPALANSFARWIRMRNVVVHEYALPAADQDSFRRWFLAGPYFARTRSAIRARSSSSVVKRLRGTWASR